MSIADAAEGPPPDGSGYPPPNLENWAPEVRHFGDPHSVPQGGTHKVWGWADTQGFAFGSPWATYIPSRKAGLPAPGTLRTRHPAPGPRHPAPGTRHPAPGTRPRPRHSAPALGTRNWLSTL